MNASGTPYFGVLPLDTTISPVPLVSVALVVRVCDVPANRPSTTAIASVWLVLSPAGAFASFAAGIASVLPVRAHAGTTALIAARINAAVQDRIVVDVPPAASVVVAGIASLAAGMRLLLAASAQSATNC